MSARVFMGFDGKSQRNIWRKCGNKACFNYEHLLIGRRVAEVRECRDCGRLLPLTQENFYRQLDGFLPWCKPCYAIRTKASELRRKIRDPETWRLTRRAEQQKYYRNRRDKIKATRKGTISLRRILTRDNWTCHICGRKVESMDDLHFDHIIPLAKGGEHSENNIAVAHATCNMRKYTMVVSSVQAQLKLL